MIYPFLFLIFNLVWADPTWKWANAVKIVEKHEFYADNEIITKPANSWQVLFGVLYHDENLKTVKDCVFYKVPGVETGILKIKTTYESVKCEKLLFTPGDQEWKNLKAFQYSLQNNFLTFSLTNEKFEILKWDVALFNVFEHPKPKSLMSSSEYRSPKIIHLSPYKGVKSIKLEKAAALSDKTLCHAISEDCKEISPSVCTQCAGPWYEIPNGCHTGPKYCGNIDCGSKNQPACRRGMKYQKSSADFNCREDSSFAYCSKGLSIQCQGNLPYCI